MAKDEKAQEITIADALAKNKIAYGSPDHIRLIEAGYGMTVEKARTIVKERPANPQSWPYELYEKAVNMLEAINAKPVVIDKTPGWRRDRSENY